MQINQGREKDAVAENRTETFTGTVWADPVLSGVPDVTVNTVVFLPGARTHWHTHDAGQILLVTHGLGYAQTRVGDGTWISPGDVVHFPPGEEHWHGAGPDTYMVHTAISLGGHEWLAEVTEEEFRSAVSSAPRP